MLKIVTNFVMYILLNNYILCDALMRNIGILIAISSSNHKSTIKERFVFVLCYIWALCSRVAL